MAIAELTEKVNKYDQKLARILSAAAEVFAEQGYDRASIRMVAERAKVSVAGLYYYVRSKEELLFLIQYSVFSELVDKFEAEQKELSSPEEKLRRFVGNHLERFLGNMPELVVCSREIDRLKGEFREQIEQKHRAYFGQAARLFALLAERHELPPVEARTAALAMFGSINWIHTWYRPESGPSAIELADAIVRLYLRGFLGDQAL